jgi:hypothetical protein
MRENHGEVKLIDGKRVATPEYRAWQQMKNRCLNPKAHDYRYYGGRGITMHPAWAESFCAFLADAGRRPSAELTLDRIDGNQGYVPGNVRWATRETQARNRAYATTKAWLLAERLGIKRMTAAHMIWQVRAKDRGDTRAFELSPTREAAIRDFLKECI